MLYIASTANDSFLQGNKSISRLAEIIINSEGESGHNTEYLFELTKGSFYI